MYLQLHQIQQLNVFYGVEVSVVIVTYLVFATEFGVISAECRAVPC